MMLAGAMLALGASIIFYYWRIGRLPPESSSSPVKSWIRTIIPASALASSSTTIMAISLFPDFEVALGLLLWACFAGLMDADCRGLLLGAADGFHE